MMEPRYQEVPSANVPEIAVGGIRARIISGEALSIKSPVHTITPVHYIHFTLQPHTSLTHPVPATFNAFIYVLCGSGELADESIHAGFCAVLTVEGDAFTVKAGEQEFAFVFLAGMPIKEPVVQHGPFVLCSAQDLQQTFHDFDLNLNGFERARHWHSTIAKHCPLLSWFLSAWKFLNLFIRVLCVCVCFL